MSKIVIFIFILVGCSKTHEQIDFSCKDKKISFSKSNEFSVNNFPSRLVNQKLAQIPFDLPGLFLKSPKINIDEQQSGLVTPVCNYNGISKFKIGSSNEVSNTVYVSDYNSIYAVPKDLLAKISLNPLDYLTLFTEDNLDQFNLKEGNSNFNFKKLGTDWFLNDQKLDFTQINEFLSSLMKNKYIKSRAKKTPTYIFVSDLTVLEIEIDNGVWISTPELPDTYLSGISESLFHAGAAGLARNRQIFNLEDVNLVEIEGFESKIKIEKNLETWAVNSQAADLVFVNDYLNFLKNLKVFYFTEEKTFKAKGKIIINSKNILEIGDYFILPNADIGYYARYDGKVFILSEMQVKKLFPNLEILLVAR